MAHEVLDVREIYRQHADFVWRTLGRFGVPERDRQDQTQEVFVIVHRQLSKFRHDAALTTWLFAIARPMGTVWASSATVVTGCQVENVVFSVGP